MGKKQKKYAVSEYVEATSEVADAYDTAEKREGVSLPRPNLYQKAVAKARARDPNVRG